MYITVRPCLMSAVRRCAVRFRVSPTEEATAPRFVCDRHWRLVPELNRSRLRQAHPRKLGEVVWRQAVESAVRAVLVSLGTTSEAR